MEPRRYTVGLTTTPSAPTNGNGNEVVSGKKISNKPIEKKKKKDFEHKKKRGDTQFGGHLFLTVLLMTLLLFF